MEAELDELVRFRAGGRCEYCGFPEAFAELPFQLDHIVARQHGGRTESANLAFVCCFCNRHKGPTLAGVDPVTEAIVCLYNSSGKSEMLNTDVEAVGAVIREALAGVKIAQEALKEVYGVDWEAK